MIAIHGDSRSNKTLYFGQSRLRNKFRLVAGEIRIKKYAEKAARERQT